MKRFVCALFTVIGLLCVIFPGQITAGLPYVLGGAMTAVGAAYSIAYFRNRDEWKQYSPELANGMILFVMGILCMLHGADSIVPLGTTWAIIGLRKASRSLSRMLENFGGGVTFYASLAEFLVRLSCSVVLLFYPAEKFETHVVLLGMELIVVSIRFTRRASYVPDEEEQMG